MSKITIDRAVVERAMEAMLNFPGDISDEMFESIRALKAALAESAQEPAFHGFMSDDGTQVDVCFSPSAPRRDGTYATAYYTAPPQRRPLTEKEMYIVEEEARKNFRLAQSGPRGQMITYWDSLTPWLIRAVERAHGIKE